MTWEPSFSLPHQSVARPMPQVSRAPSELMPPSRSCRRQFLLLAASCGFISQFSEDWGCSKAETSQALTSEIWPEAWLCGTERDLKLPPQADCSSQWRIPMWASWQSYASINTSSITCERFISPLSLTITCLSFFSLSHETSVTFTVQFGSQTSRSKGRIFLKLYLK